MAERFTLLSELGRGGMGVVCMARDEETGKIVALKLLHPVFAADPDYITRFERELELARRIHSAHVVEVLGYGVRSGQPYLALEFVDGPSLRECLTTKGQYSWPEARALLAQIAQGLADAHAAGVIHRDLKPSNVLIGSNGVAKLADFGIAKGIDLTRVTGTSTLLGTPTYLPPEGPIDERSDLYSLGVIAYEMLVGSPPFEGRTYQEVILRHVRETPNLEKLPKEARAFVGRLLAKNPSKRPQRAAEVAALLGAAQVRAAAAAPTRAILPGAAPAPPTLAPAPPARPSALPPAQTLRSKPPRAPGRSGSGGLGPASGQPAGSRSVPALARRNTTPIFVGLGLIGLVLIVGTGALLVSGAIGAPNKPSPSAIALATPTATPSSSPSSIPTRVPSGTFTRTGNHYAPSASFSGTITLLQDGRVLIAGGFHGGDKSFTPYATAQLYDPRTGTFSLTASMAVPRSNHTATLLRDGRVLITGGFSQPNGLADGRYLASAELFDPKTGRFSPTGSMVHARAWQTATLLADGRVLVVGGNRFPDLPATAELYDPKTGRFTAIGSVLSDNRSSHTATTLADGRILIAGDSHDSAAVLYDPATKKFRKTGSMTTLRDTNAAVLLPGGRVLIVGGMSLAEPNIASAELYDPTTGKFSKTGSMGTPRRQIDAFLLQTGRVLVVGTEPTAELYYPAGGTFSPTDSPEATVILATRLQDGRVLAIEDGNVAEIYQP